MTDFARIHRGLALPRRKPGLHRPILDVPVPAQMVLPLLGYRDRPLSPCVAVGDRVRAGDALAETLVASVSGRVAAIESHAVLSRALTQAPCIVIERDEASEAESSPESSSLETASPGRLGRLAGIDGRGGAGFPVAAKLAALAARAQDGSAGCRRLLINACECEPGIACDEALMQTNAPGVIAAIGLLVDALRPDETMIVIERDKDAALHAMMAALGGIDEVTLVRIEPVYPSGAERALVDLIARLRGEAVLGDAERPVDRGVLCLNVATVYAAGEILSGRVSNSRIVTVEGVEPDGGVNARVVFGTPVRAVLAACGLSVPAGSMLHVGGPLSGHAVDSFDAPVTATTLALSIRLPHRQAGMPRPCIRCGDCATVCPVELQPQQLYWHATAGDHAALGRAHLGRCLECSCCDLVCPSLLPLTATFRSSRAAIARSTATAAEADRADALYRRREARRVRDEARTLERAPVVANDVTPHPPPGILSADAPVPERTSAGDATINAALMRAKALASARAGKRAPAGTDLPGDGSDSPEQARVQVRARAPATTPNRSDLDV